MDAENSTSEMADGGGEKASPEDDFFCWFIEGIGILVIGLVGLFGNSCSMVLFSKQKVHRIFHRLLLLLTLFDVMYVVCSLMLFSLSKFVESYDMVYRIYLLPYLLPMAHIGLMGSVYCTLALTIERFLAVCYPFLKHRRVYTSKAFILPVVIFTLLYNLPKFFELYVKKEIVVKNSTDTNNETILVDVCSPALAILTNLTSVTESTARNCSATVQENPNPNEEENQEFQISIAPTSLRTNRIYIRVYILWLNIIVQIIIPFVLLIVLNIRTYNKIVEFEQTLSMTVRRVSFKNASGKINRPRGGPHHPDPEDDSASHEMEQLMQSEIQDLNNQHGRNLSGGSDKSSGRSGLLRSIRKSMKRSLSTRNNSTIHHQDASSASDLRRREVVLAKISLYMVFVFLICHSVKIVPNIYEMVQTYLADYHPNTIPWPTWVSRMTNISHFLLTFACSANFYIYFAKHSQKMQRLFSCRWSNCRRRSGDSDSEDQDGLDSPLSKSVAKQMMTTVTDDGHHNHIQMVSRINVPGPRSSRTPSFSVTLV